jgi:hypothetical protein
MVRQGVFEVQLVEASSKNPFPEHTKDGMHFIEAEPKAEYYIRLRRIPCSSPSLNTSPYMRTFIKVDNHDLGNDGSFVWNNHNPVASSYYFGPKSYQNGIESVNSLRFSTPDHFQIEDQAFSLDKFLDKMGRIEVHVYEGNLRFVSNCNNGSYTKSSFQQFHEENTMVVPVSQNSGEKEKFVLSKPGQKVMPDIPTSRASFQIGRCIDVITLRYCSAKGLILAGVISHPLAITWRGGLPPPHRPVSLSPGEVSARPNYRTEMHRIIGDPTPDGNIPHRTVEVLVIDDGSDDDVDM